MTQKRPKYIREERNGKIVYVPTSGDPSATAPLARRRAARPSPHLSGLTSQLFSWAGRLCDRWLPPIAITGAATLTVGLGWLGWQSITNPDMIYWINQFAPGNLNRKIPAADQPKTLNEVLAHLKRNKKMPGEPIVLASDFSFYASLDSAIAVAIPIRVDRQDSACPTGCQAIQEIQVYRALELPKLIRLFQRKRRFRRASRVSIGGPSEADLNRLVRSLTRSGSNEGNASPMAMSVIKLENTGDNHRWVLLSGLKSKGNSRASFGQILHVNPKRTQLNIMVNWLSPSGKSPVWQDITNDGQAEIVIDQSVELEPSFSVYTIDQAPNGDPWVSPITLSKAAIASSRYHDALKLAKNGLWNQAQSQLETIKANSDPWPKGAQAQLELIKLHARVLEEDTNLAFSDPVAEIQSLLIRGDWKPAQAKLLSSRNIFDAVEVVLDSDNGQIGDRIHTAAQVGPDKNAAIDWGIIYHYARGGKAQAQSWVQKNHPQAKSRLEPLFKKLAYPSPKKSNAAIPAAVESRGL